MGKLVYILFFFISFVGYSQKLNHNAQLSTGYNRVGFYNELSYKIGSKNHLVKIGVRHYTFDNFFEKNTIGLSIDYSYMLNSKNDKFYFYPGASFTVFSEDKDHVVAVLKEYKLINGIGYNIIKNLSFYYQLGFGIIDVKSKLKDVEEVVKINYFNYEMVFGLNYRFGNSTK